MLGTRLFGEARSISWMYPFSLEGFKATGAGKLLRRIIACCRGFIPRLVDRTGVSAVTTDLRRILTIHRSQLIGPKRRLSSFIRKVV